MPEAAGPPHQPISEEANDARNPARPRPDNLEDWLKERLESAARTVLGLVITGSGVRVCYFYSADPEMAIRVWEQELQPNIRFHQATFRVHPDPEWQMYRRFLA